MAEGPRGNGWVEPYCFIHLAYKNESAGHRVTHCSSTTAEPKVEPLAAKVILPLQGVAQDYTWYWIRSCRPWNPIDKPVRNPQKLLYQRTPN